MTLNKAKTATVICVALMFASTILATARAQDVARYLDPGVIPTNLRDIHSLTAIPAGVTPDKTYTTKAWLSIRPNPVGVNQPVLVNLWMAPPTLYQSYSGYKVTITDPSGQVNVQTVNSYPADMTAWFEYTVDKVGTWKFKFDFPGAFFYAGNYTIPQGAWSGSSVGGDRYLSLPQSRWYKPTSDGPYDIVVQSDMVASWQPVPLPSDYWTRPISPENREWWPIAGYYPGTGVVGTPGYDWPAQTNAYQSNYLFTPYVQAPNTPHVLWRRVSALGGLLGGPNGDWSLTQAGNPPSIIYQGRCYDAVTKVYNGKVQTVWECYDLRTGQVYWDQVDLPAAQWILPQTALGEVSGANSGGYLGAMLPRVLGTISNGFLLTYNPSTGALFQNISLAPLTTGTYYMGTDFAYFLTVQDLGASRPYTDRYRLINWTAHGETGPAGSLINIKMRVLNNITWPFSSLGTVDFETGVAAQTTGITSAASSTSEDVFVMAADIRTGTLLWNHTSGFYSFATYSQSIADHGKFAIHMTDGRIHAYDLRTGTHEWDNDISTQTVWSAWFSYGIQGYGGNIISNQYNGVAAYDWATGKLKWLYQAPAAYPYETPYEGTYAFFTTPDIIADGKIYAYTGEHTPSQPICRGWGLHCINATDGTKVWSITGSMTPGAVADGYLSAGNSYDGYMYVFGKGQSKTTVETPGVAVPKGTAITIKGSVMDMSPGDQGSENNPTARLDSPTQAGTTPCVSKDSMSTQMEYLYMQRPIDGLYHNVTTTGVPVVLTAIDSTGAATEIGSTTTNGYYGTFGVAWTPAKEGTYTIVASFAGDESYGSSSAANSLTVGPAPTTPASTSSTAQTVTTPDYSGLLYAILAAVIVAIVIGLVAVFRKR